jgi:hypothetical protein
MKLNIFINDKLYKTVTVKGDSYNPMFIWPDIQADRDCGLLASYAITKGINLRFEKVEKIKK